MQLCIINMYDTEEWLKGFEEVFAEVQRQLGISIKLLCLSYKDKSVLSMIQKNKIEAIILTGSTHRVLKKGSATLPTQITKIGIPILGICYGYEWLVKNMGGKIGTFEKEKLQKYSKMFPITYPFSVPMRKYEFVHHDYIETIPTTWIECIRDPSKKEIWMGYDPSSKIVGIQFHPEKHTSSGVAFMSAWIKWLQK